MARINLRLLTLLGLVTSLALASRGVSSSPQGPPAPRPDALAALFATLKPQPDATATSGDPAPTQRR